MNIVTVFGLKRLNHVTRTIHAHPLVVSNAALSANIELLKVHINIQEFTYTDSSKKIKSFLNNTKKNEKLVEQNLDFIRDKIIGKEGQELEREARQLFIKWREANNKILGYIQKGKISEAILAETEEHKQFLKLEKKILSLLSYARNKADEFLILAQESHEEVENIVFSITATGISLSVLIAIWTSKVVFKAEKVLKKSLQSQKMEALGTLTGGIAHEFNNLLAPILGYTELMLSKDDNNLDKDNLLEIQKAAKRARSLVQKMLAYGRQSLSKKEVTNLESIIKDVVKLMERTIPPDVSIIVDEKESNSNILCMPNEIHQVILNICINAIQAMPQGGELSLKVMNPELNSRFINGDTQKQNSFVCLRIKDTGMGMDQTTVEKVFDPFFTTKKIGDGTGMGLSVAHGIIDQHNGHIDIESVLEKGTVFYIYLPASDETEKQVPEVSTDHFEIENGQVLLIDDEKMIIN